MANAGMIRHKRKMKRKGYVVKGVTKRSDWWSCAWTSEYHRDGNSRQAIKRDTRREVEAVA